MIQLFYATKNKYKIENMKNRLVGLDIKLLTPYDLNINIDVKEIGSTVIENALLKAKTYQKIVKIPTIAGDSSLFIEKFKIQPGMHVRRINNEYLSDDELEDYYENELNKIGGESIAYYVTGLAYVDESYIDCIEIKEDEFILTSNKFKGKRNDDALGRLEYDFKINKYFCEMTNEDKIKRGLLFDEECMNFIIENLRRTHEHKNKK